MKKLLDPIDSTLECLRETWIFDEHGKIRFLGIENVRSEEITKIHKTQSSVPSSSCKTGSWPGISRSSENNGDVKLR